MTNKHETTMSHPLENHEKVRIDFAELERVFPDRETIARAIYFLNESLGSAVEFHDSRNGRR
jgi:hypothetical protein